MPITDLGGQCQRDEEREGGGKEEGEVRNATVLKLEINLISNDLELSRFPIRNLWGRYLIAMMGI